MRLLGLSVFDEPENDDLIMAHLVLRDGTIVEAPFIVEFGNPGELSTVNPCSDVFEHEWETMTAAQIRLIISAVAAFDQASQDPDHPELNQRIRKRDLAELQELRKRFSIREKVGV
jgi:hypothetical protein